MRIASSVGSAGASEVPGGDEADRVGDIERVARRPDADAGSVGDNFEAERTDAALVQHLNADGPHHGGLAIRKLACCPLWQRSRATTDVTADVFNPHWLLPSVGSPETRSATAEPLFDVCRLLCGDLGR